ncbi:MAG TPA: NAD-dependent epimerase/dehydratase family protein [Dehalococcoidia bacterium]|nr:NAD-dependent epimerase/dehydratase family protein [Dehalococcoidia bacterium]
MEDVDNLGACFVTGGAGFIGSHLSERLLAAGNAVTVFDNLSLGRTEWVQHLFAHPRFRFVKGDLRDTDAVRQAIAGHEVVFHLGANTDIPRGNEDPRIDLENDILATFTLLEAMRHHGIRRLAFASSSTVFGEPDVRPTPETVGPLLPISLYGAGKLACEGLISAYCHLFGMEAWMFRFGNVVGPRMGHGILHDFIAKLRRDPRRLEVLGDGNQEKNYFLVEDCIDGILYAMRHANGQSCDVFNLGCASTLKASEIARIVIEEMGLEDVDVHYTGGRRGWPGDVPVVIYDAGKMKRLGWQAGHTSAEAVRAALRRILQAEAPVPAAAWEAAR